MGVTEFVEKVGENMGNNMYTYATSSGLAGISGMSGTSGVYYVAEGEKGGKGMMQSMKGYFHTYRDWILTFLFVVIVDHFIFDGVMREKIKVYFDKAKDKLKHVKEN